MSDNQELQEENSGANNNSKIIGSYLSLITKAESRYEGTLVEVDRVKKTMSLKNVKNMGTEGRRNGANEQPAGDAILGMVKFRVDLIKTFEIIDKPVEEEEEEQPDEDLDPAIVSSMEEQNNQKDKDPQDEKQKPQKKYESRRNDDWSKGTNIKKSSQQEGDSSAETPGKDYEKKEAKQYGGQKEKVIGELQPVNDKYQKKFDEAYDFSKHQMEKGDSKPEGEKIKKEGEEGKTEKPKYDKNADFFDNITNSTLEPSGDRGRGRGGGRGFRGGYRGYQGGEDAFPRGGYRGRGNRGGYDNNNREDNGEWWNNNRGRGSYRGNRGRGNYQGYGDGTTGAQGDRKKLYSDTLRDPNDPNFHKRDDDDGTADPNTKSFFDNNQRGGYRGRGRGERGWRGGGRGGRGGRPMTGVQAEARDEETFGTFTSQNFKFNHEQNPSRGGRGGARGGRGRGRGDAEVAQRPERTQKYNTDFYKGGGDYKYPSEPVVEDGHKDFFDIKKKPGQQSRAKNRFAAMMNPKKKNKQEDDDESEEEGSNNKELEANAD